MHRAGTYLAAFVMLAAVAVATAVGQVIVHLLPTGLVS